MFKIPLARIDEWAKKRPDGYKEHLLTSGKVEGQFLVIPPGVYLDLKKTYDQNNVTVPARAAACCGSKPQAKTNFPSISTQIKNLAGATKRVVGRVLTGERVIIPQEEQDRRKAICEGCQDFLNGRCKHCGCFMKWKKMLSSEKCPIGKW